MKPVSESEVKKHGESICEAVNLTASLVRFRFSSGSKFKYIYGTSKLTARLLITPRMGTFQLCAKYPRGSASFKRQNKKFID